jgi:predicted nucleotidyltransferase
VEEYLKSLNAVDSVRVAIINSNVVTYRLRLRNDTADLQRLIEFGEVLEQEDFPQVSTQGEDQMILNYSYIDRGAGN